MVSNGSATPASKRHARAQTNNPRGFRRRGSRSNGKQGRDDGDNPRYRSTHHRTASWRRQNEAVQAVLFLPRLAFGMDWQALVCRRVRRLAPRPLSPHSCATTPRQWPKVTLNREEPGNRVMSIQTIHDEFANHIQSGKPSPKMPTQGSHDPAPSLADFRKSAAKISKEWNSVFELLATR